MELNSQTYNRWVLNEAILWETKHRSRKIGCGSKVFCPEMKKKLYQEFLQIRNNGMKAKR